MIFPHSIPLEQHFESSSLYLSLSLCRSVKSEREITLMRYVAYISSMAHVAVMRSAKPNMMEYQLEAQFLYEAYHKGGCRHTAYTSICACGPSGAVLHYGHAGEPNDKLITERDMALLDMGAVYHGYSSDITCSFPISSRFSSQQTLIYETVLNAQRAVFHLVQPGVLWSICHKAAEREIVRGLMRAGVLEGAEEEIFAAELGCVFFPHGLGHLIGCDAHDVGGYIDSITPSRPAERGVNKLRTARLLEENMVLTNEPGCYFIGYLLDQAIANPRQSPFINQEVLDSYRTFGGVRLEDMFVVTATGASNITLCPRTVLEVEEVMSGGSWPPVRDMAPELKRRWSVLSDDRCAMKEVDIPLA
mmetsp:Transcript_22458/g.22648  ORF Transcript_22458/g.22648 Transcript_22458/m.22648 type:complete len:361 (-) Transcript_22458:173-1255(-)